MPLTDTEIKKFKPEDKTYRRSDGGGLFLEVSKTGSKLWRMAYRFLGKQKTLYIGSYPAISLKQARSKRDDAKILLAEGKDPSAVARLEKTKRKLAQENTFSAIADELLLKDEKEGKSEATLSKKRWYFELAAKDLGNRVIGDISSLDILVPLKRIEGKGNYETARRVRAFIGQVFRYAIATGRAENDPTFGLRGALITPKAEHRAAILEPEKFGKLLRAIWEYGGSPTTVAALKLMAFLYPRPGELRQATWSEFDLERKIWTIPAERAKMRREHRKPLPDQAVSVLKELHKITGRYELTFPAQGNYNRPLSENTLNQALRRIGIEKHEATSHGFRASASTLLNESGLWSPDAIEAELAHVGENAVRAAYHRGQYWDERVRMSDWWAGEIMRLNDRTLS